MNHSYCLAWNDATQCHVPAPETARRRGKSRTALALAPLALLLGALLAPHAGAQALPTGEKLVSGAATVHRNGSHMVVDQKTDKAILQWNSFDIGRGASVRFEQKNLSDIALNRVMGGGRSQIDGYLGAKGQVWLVNPNGVVFGKHSQVDVGGLVASTLGMTDSDFEAGNRVFTRDPAKATGGITVHEGARITMTGGAAHGLLALLAPEVRNEGMLSAEKGNVVLAAGAGVTLKAGAGGQLEVAVSPAMLRTLIENKGMIMADGGQVWMTARAANALSGSMVSNTGQVQAHTLEHREGRILLLGDMRHGDVVHGGLLDASAPDAGDGGLVETRAARVQIPAGARVTTAAARGNTGLWHSHSAADLKITAGGAPVASNGIGADTLANALADTHIALHTEAAGNDQGNIHVDADFAYRRNQLTLSAGRSIDVQARVSVNDTGTLRLNYGGTAGNAGTVPTADSYLFVLGKVDFAKEGSGLLGINGHDFRVIKSLDALQAMDTGPTARYALGGELDAHETAGWNGGKGFAPIGSDAQPFQGTFDGLGQNINRLTINRPDQDGVGLFGHATNATLRNMFLVDGNVKGKNSVGALVGVNKADKGGVARIFSVHGELEVRGLHQVGGLVGRHDADAGTASIARSMLKADVSGLEDIGGLVGRSQATSGGTAVILEAAVRGSVSGRNGVGGLVGTQMNQGGTATIERSQAHGSVKGVEHVGGLAGDNHSIDKGVALILSASANGAVKGFERVGGLVGGNNADSGEALIIDSHASGNASGYQSVGGLVGSHRAGAGGLADIDGARATGEVRGVTQTGELVGSKDAGSGTARISRYQPSGQISSVPEAGSLVGANHSASSASNLQAHASAQVQGTSASAGADALPRMLQRTAGSPGMSDATPAAHKASAPGNASISTQTAAIDQEQKEDRP